MCGIFGVVTGNNPALSATHISQVVNQLLRFSETRGSEATGAAACLSGRIEILKSARSGSALMKTREYRDFLQRTANQLRLGGALIGHSRMVTNGAQELHDNNQPVRKGGIVGIHNGIVVNVDELWQANPALAREHEIDTEVILALVQRHKDAGLDLEAATAKALAETSGMASLAVFSQDDGELVLATNNGSLYTWRDPQTDLFVFASERYILQQALRAAHLIGKTDVQTVTQVAPGASLAVSMARAVANGAANGSGAKPRIIKDVSGRLAGRSGGYTASASPNYDTSVAERHFVEATARIDQLKRCSRCILPETIPYIAFDGDGVCNYCRYYEPINLKGEAALEEAVASYRRTDGRPDCIVAFSGGRDSSYGLHYIKKEMGLNPIAYTYDWGMVTDLARRNQSRMCGQLGVEHILVSANIARKRANISKNVKAWLKAPNLGTIPLFMAGDKQFFYHAHRLAKHNDIPLLMFSENLLEKTHFKSGFCGIEPDFGKDNTYTLKAKDKLTLATFYAKAFLTNPSYLNSSMVDTLGAFGSYYVLPHEICWLFQYIPWNEEKVDRTLLGQYDWETATDTNTTWRIGDGTASFYNYIYYTMAGFTENDTFRSNQIREGTLDRDTALALARDNNQPRWESIAWYAQTVDLDFNHTLDVINRAPRLY